MTQAGAAGSLREGLFETLTVLRLEVDVLCARSGCNVVNSGMPDRAVHRGQSSCIPGAGPCATKVGSQWGPAIYQSTWRYSSVADEYTARFRR